MKRNPMLISSLMAACLLASCGGNSSASHSWDYAGEAQENVITLRSANNVDETTNVGTFSLPETPMVFSSKPDSTGIMLFDADNALSSSNVEELEEVPYDTLKDNKIDIQSFSMSEDLSGLTITYDAANNHKVGALIHREYTYRGLYALLTPYDRPEDTCDPLVVNGGDFEFEEKYLKSKDVEDQSGTAQMAVNIALNVVNVGFGIGTGNPVTVVNGLLGVFNSVWNRFFGGPDIGKMLKEITAKLNAMDKKLDALSQTLAKNYEQLLAETIKTQGLVQDVMIRQMNSDVASFQETYINEADNIRREAGIYLQPLYRNFANSPTAIEVYFRKNNDQKYERVLYADTSDKAKSLVTVNFSSMAYSMEFLNNHNSTLQEGFFEAFNKDMEEAVKAHKLYLPSDMTEEEFQSFLVGAIQEKFMMSFWRDNPNKLVEYTNILTNMCRRINASDGTNVLDSYLNRLKYMCNFSNETYNMAISILSGLLYELDSNVANAFLAGCYLHIDQSELSKAYVAATKNIKNTYANWVKTPKNYSFVVGSVISGDAVSLMWDNKWSKLGNHPDFATSLRLDKLTQRQKGVGVDLPYVLDVEQHKYSEWNILSSGDYLKMSLRTRLMKELGLIKSDISFLDYLHGSEIIGNWPIKSYKDAVRTYGGIPFENALFVTPVESRALQDSDKGLTVYCDGQGNPGASWYKVGQKYEFKNSNDSGCWIGTGLECATVSVKTGTLYNAKQLVSAYARYDEGHSKWKNDEHWSFTMGNYVNPYFVLHY